MPVHAPIRKHEVVAVFLCGLAGAVLAVVLALNPVATVPGATSPPTGVIVTWTIEIDPATEERAWKHTERTPDGIEVGSGYLAAGTARVPPEPITPGLAAIIGLSLGILTGSGVLVIARSQRWPAPPPSHVGGVPRPEPRRN